MVSRGHHFASEPFLFIFVEAQSPHTPSPVQTQPLRFITPTMPAATGPVIQPLAQRKGSQLSIGATVTGIDVENLSGEYITP